MEGTSAETMKRQNLEEIECSEINAILPSLLEQDLVTDIECRWIAGCDQLLAKQSAIYKVIMSKTKEEAAHLTESFRTLTCHCHADELSCKTSDGKDEADKNVLQDKPNPLLFDTVLACLVRYLPLDDIKQSRLVCFKWNSAAEICLRERCKIHFRPDGLIPQTFMEISKYSLPDRPFSAYKFSRSDVDHRWSINKMNDFFAKWGKNIKQVEFDNILLHDELQTADSKNAKRNRYRTVDFNDLEVYDVTPWMAKMSNLCSLKIQPAKKEIRRRTEITSFDISIEKLATLKTVFLGNCRILTNSERVTFLPSSNVRLIDISFRRLGKVEVRKDFCYNDYFDFSQTATLVLSDQKHKNVKFDMEGQIFNKKQLNLRNVTLIHWETAKGDVNLLKLDGSDFTKRNYFKISRMIIDNAEVTLSVLPLTLEKLRFGENVKIVGEEPFQLPDLKYFGFEAKGDNSRMLANFANCPKLTDVELSSDAYYSGLILNLDWIPRSVKKLRIGDGMTVMFQFVNGDLELDTLLLDNITYFSDCKSILERIKPKVLVISYRRPLDSSEIVEIILAYKQIGTIVFGTLQQNVDLCKNIPFEGSTFSRYVDKKSNYYKFENQVGHAIERKEFEDFNGVVADMDDEHFG